MGGGGMNDLVDLVGRADAERFRAYQRSLGLGATLDLDGVPGVHLGLAEAWGTHAAFTGRAELPPPGTIEAVLDWLDARHPGSWQVSARPEQVDGLSSCGLQILRVLGVLVSDAPPRHALPDGISVGAATDEAEFLSVFGPTLAPAVRGLFGRSTHHFLVLRAHGRAVGCAQVSETDGCAAVSGVTVRPEWRRRGLGRLLSAAATTRAIQEAGLAWLHCEAELIDFYRRLGYRPLTGHLHLGPRGDS
jgi:GNAT superfamily N-acetyltransferase